MVIGMNVLDAITEVDMESEVVFNVGSIVVKVSGDEGPDVVGVDTIELLLGGLVKMVLEGGVRMLVESWMVVGRAV